MKSPFNLDKMYTDFIDKENDKNYKERYKDNEGWYKASSAGFCSRKMYYESVMKAEPTNPPSSDSKMKMRLGTVFHYELQGALKSLSSSDISIYTESIDTIYIDTESIDNKEKTITDSKKESKIHIEGNIQIDELNVRGHYDIVFEGSKVYLYDIKTIGSYPWRMKFGLKKNTQPDNSRQYPLQLGTYAIGVEDLFGKIDGMYLYYYNKDTSKTKTIEVPMIEKSKAWIYWEGINEEHAKGLPKLELGSSPEQQWACGYCPFKDICQPDDFIKFQKKKGVWR